MRVCSRLALLACAAFAAGVAGCALHESGPECDDDIDNDVDGRVDCADTDCTLDPACQTCGNSRLDDSEACDDGNLETGDGCDDRCRIEGCGDGVVNAGEQCDDGNLEPGDGCNFRCQTDTCGNFRVDSGEQCDDGNARSGDGCDARCQIEFGARCGDFVVDFNLGEACDDGNRQAGDGCAPDCTQEFCGDGVITPRFGEQCEGTVTPSGSPCQFCRIVLCGNGALDAGEQCDDGNPRGGDGCTECRIDRCGDGRRIGAEECDDGNTRSGDGCTAACVREVCGDGVRQPLLGELCDGGLGCSATCNPSSFCFDDDVCFAPLVRRNLPVRTVNALVGGDLFPGGSARELAATTVSTSAVILVPLSEVGAPGAAEVRFDLGDVQRIATADVDNDDDLDFVGHDFNQRLRLWRRNGATLQASFIGQLDARAVHLDFADLAAPAAPAVDRPDLVAIAAGGSGAVLLETTTALPFAVPGAFAAAVPDRGVLVVLTAGALHPFDLVGAGTDDVALVPLPPLLFDGQGIDVAVGQFDGDGGARSVVVLAASPDRLWRFDLDDGAWSAPVDLGAAPLGAALTVGDLDGDGLDDLLVHDAARGRLLLHRAAEGFASIAVPSVSAPSRPLLFDVDGDGDLDVAQMGGAPTAQGDLLIWRRQ